MSIHLVQRRCGYDSAIAAAQPDDLIVLLGEGVAAVLDGALNCYASAYDLDARGLASFAAPTITRIDDEQLVALCCSRSPCVTWTS